MGRFFKLGLFLFFTSYFCVSKPLLKNEYISGAAFKSVADFVFDTKKSFNPRDVF